MLLHCKQSACLVQRGHISFPRLRQVVAVQPKTQPAKRSQYAENWLQTRKPPFVTARGLRLSPPVLGVAGLAQGHQQADDITGTKSWCSSPLHREEASRPRSPCFCWWASELAAPLHPQPCLPPSTDLIRIAPVRILQCSGDSQ